MKHASPATLEEFAPFLEQIRRIDGVREKQCGVFYRKSKAFLHFHEDPSGIFVDVRTESEGPFSRFEVTTKSQQRLLLAKVNNDISK